MEAQGLDRKLLAKRGANAVLKMVLEDGFFHADPHAGNVLYLPANRIAFLDFGMMGRLSESRREQIVRLLSAMVNKDVGGVTDILLDWAGDTNAEVDNLTVEVDAFLDSYHGVPLKQLKLASMLGDITIIMRNHQLTLPPDLTLLFKVFITLEGLGRQLDPDFAVFNPCHVFTLYARGYRKTWPAQRWKCFGHHYQYAAGHSSLATHHTPRRITSACGHHQIG